jgi:hypothetical protein
LAIGISQRENLCPNRLQTLQWCDTFPLATAEVGNLVGSGRGCQEAILDQLEKFTRAAFSLERRACRQICAQSANIGESGIRVTDYRGMADKGVILGAERNGLVLTVAERGDVDYHTQVRILSWLGYHDPQVRR